jgi:predicted TIM-barrel fold metal-dependent hydrolase
MRALQAALSPARAAFAMKRAVVDTHVHAFDLGRFPLPKGVAYLPPAVPAARLNKLGAKHLVIVHPSVYGHDVTPSIDAVQQLGLAKARAIIAFDQDRLPTTQDISAWHAEGVRGVRINLASVGSDPSAEELERVALAHAELIRSFGWVLDFHLHASPHLALLRQFAHKLRCASSSLSQQS